MSAVLVALSFVPGLLAIAWHVRARRAARRLAAELEAEREETRRRYLEDEEITERRQSFSAWPWSHR